MKINDIDVNAAIMEAAATGDRATVELLLAHQGADVNAVDKAGRTPLDCANKVEIVAFLKANGAMRGEYLKSAIDLSPSACTLKGERDAVPLPVRAISELLFLPHGTQQADAIPPPQVR